MSGVARPELEQLREHCARVATPRDPGRAVVTGMNLIVIAYILCAGLPFGRLANLAPFAPSGARGVFAAASIVFFAFIGFDTVACAAEEARPVCCRNSARQATSPQAPICMSYGV
jgi:hypothetical protein